VLHSWWMVVATGSEVMRLPADWVASEALPVEVPTAGGPVDLRELARNLGDGPRTVVVDDGDAGTFTVSFVRGGLTLV
jgi:hypothetical protein